MTGLQRPFFVHAESSTNRCLAAFCGDSTMRLTPWQSWRLQEYFSLH